MLLLVVEVKTREIEERCIKGPNFGEHGYVCIYVYIFVIGLIIQLLNRLVQCIELQS